MLVARSLATSLSLATASRAHPRLAAPEGVGALTVRDFPHRLLAAPYTPHDASPAPLPLHAPPSYSPTHDALALLPFSSPPGAAAVGVMVTPPPGVPDGDPAATPRLLEHLALGAPPPVPPAHAPPPPSTMPPVLADAEAETLRARAVTTTTALLTASPADTGAPVAIALARFRAFVAYLTAAHGRGVPHVGRLTAALQRSGSDARRTAVAADMLVMCAELGAPPELAARRTAAGAYAEVHALPPVLARALLSVLQGHTVPTGALLAAPPTGDDDAVTAALTAALAAEVLPLAGQDLRLAPLPEPPAGLALDDGDALTADELDTTTTAMTVHALRTAYAAFSRAGLHPYTHATAHWLPTFPSRVTAIPATLSLARHGVPYTRTLTGFRAVLATEGHLEERASAIMLDDLVGFLSAAQPDGADGDTLVATLLRSNTAVTSLVTMPAATAASIAGVLTAALATVRLNETRILAATDTALARNTAAWYVCLACDMTRGTPCVQPHHANPPTRLQARTRHGRGGHRLCARVLQAVPHHGGARRTAAAHCRRV